MAVVHIPSLLRDLTGGRSEVEVSGRTLRQIVDALDRSYPGMKARLIEDGLPRAEIAFSVDGEVATLGLLQPVNEGSEVLILPAISGG
jgi:molybdopterin converting factor small subunit